MQTTFKNSGLLRGIKALILASLAVGALSGFTSCSSGSGSDNEANVDTGNGGGGAGFTYTGPPAATDDVQAFQVNVWNNLVADNRCGACHKQGGTGTGAFVRDDDINLAYEIVNGNNLVDLSSPANSQLVTKVAGGHNCWLSDPNACRDIISGWITDWASVAGGVANVITLTAPTFHQVQNSRNFPSDASGFATHVWGELLRRNATEYCAGCHSEDAADPQAPFFASSDLDAAYRAAQSKMDLNNPALSRFVVQLRNNSHNCWSNCEDNADEMQDAIAAFANTVPITTVNSAWLTSGAVTLGGDGIVASTGGRIENNVIALYTFKPPSSSSAGEIIDEVFDVSGVNPAANLRRFGNGVTWLGSWGAIFNEGRLQSTGAGSRKLYDLISLTGEYTIEAWIAPNNVVQDDTARIVSYSGNAEMRNFTLGQSMYNYDFLARSSVSDPDGAPALSTPDADEVVQATLQHVVVTYDPVEGRRIFVNGEEATNMDDPLGGGTLANWDNSYVLALGAEVDGSNQWQGAIRLLAIHNRVLTEDDIRNNYDVGVGEKFFLLFDLSNSGLVDMPQAYVVFEVEQYDNFGYLFKNPFFISLSSDAMPGNIPIEGMRIGINGQEATRGQAFANLKTSVTDDRYTIGSGQLLSSFGTIIPIGTGPDSDQFFLTFDRIGGETYTRPVEAAPAWPTVAQMPDISNQSAIGVRHFEEINETLAAATGVDKTLAADTYETVRQQLPQSEGIAGFLPAHQMGITQLAIAYCDALANDADLRADYFPGFNFGASAGTAFGAHGSAQRGQIIDPLLENLAAHTVPASPGHGAGHLTSQPDPADVTNELNNLIDRLIGNGASTQEVVTGVCAASMGSALMLLQ